MTLATGTVKYTLGAAPVTGCGLSWTVEELDIALAGVGGGGYIRRRWCSRP